MGSCCSKQSSNQAGYSRSGKKGEADDQSKLLDRENETNEAIFQVATTPTPLLKDINFAAIDEDEDSDTDSSSIDDDKIEELLAEEEDKAEK
ncbi:hypothetical protein TRFO_16579 [Tritrichomonas foetus]|uniref:Uncharacterized protein n=1 Tax=Tritrichomonas foetus TaxID=1144522 RepID=A0A1J4KPN2_9EUKA|nr:hypothetical protein TRFO_16579 [Tritrichomonas foetus]|eukprot:OHT13265.1 hypothetical protein TRFO_16579 [Tritrichomonas foetus]